MPASQPSWVPRLPTRRPVAGTGSICRGRQDSGRQRRERTACPATNTSSLLCGNSPISTVLTVRKCSTAARSSTEYQPPGKTSSDGCTCRWIFRSIHARPHRRWRSGWSSPASTFHWRTAATFFDAATIDTSRGPLRTNTIFVSKRLRTQFPGYVDLDSGFEVLLADARKLFGVDVICPVPQTSTAVPQMPHSSNCRRFQRATGTKNSVNCLDSRIRAHCVVLWQRGHVRVCPAPRCCRLVPKPNSKNTAPA